MHVVVDTSIASMIQKGSDGNAMDPFYKAELEGKTVVISFQTVDEMLFGALRDGWGPRRHDALVSFLRRFVVVPGNYEVAEVSARVRHQAEAIGRRLGTADAWIVATAVAFGVPLVTNDRDQVIDGIAGYSYRTKPPPVELSAMPLDAAVRTP